MATLLAFHSGGVCITAKSQQETKEPPFVSLGAKVGEVGPTSALVHSYLFDQPADRLLHQPYANRTYAGRSGHVRVEYSPSKLPDLPFGVISQKKFGLYLKKARKDNFTNWIKVPKKAPLIHNLHNPDEMNLLREAREDDYSFHLLLDSLRPSTRYEYRLWIQDLDKRKVRPSQVFHFRTAPEPATLEDISFIVTTCFNHARMKDLKDQVWPVKGFRMYRAILDKIRKGDLAFDFAVFNGDTVYLDKQNSNYRRGTAKKREELRARFFDTYLTPLSREFFQHFPAYFLKDDHDWRFNDADPIFDSQTNSSSGLVQVGKYYRGPPAPSLGKKIFEEVSPVKRGPNHPPYRTFRWGQGLQIWLLETRECRYPNARQLKRYRIKGLVPPTENQPNLKLFYPDYCGTPSEEQAWGEKQFSWLMTTLKASKAYFKIIISPTPLLGPDSTVYWRVGLNPLRRKQDNHVTRYRRELTRFLQAIRKEGLENLYFISGDRHFLWHSQYQTWDKRFSLHEFGSGPFADDTVPFGKIFYGDKEGVATLQAGLRKAGFLHVQVDNVALKPLLRIRWYSMQNWKKPSLKRWSHSFEAPYVP